MHFQQNRNHNKIDSLNKPVIKIDYKMLSTNSTWKILCKHFSWNNFKRLVLLTIPNRYVVLRLNNKRKKWREIIMDCRHFQIIYYWTFTFHKKKLHERCFIGLIFWSCLDSDRRAMTFCEEKWFNLLGLKCLNT